jgi:hypothetical protein
MGTQYFSNTFPIPRAAPVEAVPTARSNAGQVEESPSRLEGSWEIGGVRQVLGTGWAVAPPWPEICSLLVVRGGP